MTRILAVLCLAGFLAAAGSTAFSGEKWRDTTGITVRTNNRNAALIRRAQSRQHGFISKEGDMYITRGPSGNLYFCEP